MKNKIILAIISLSLILVLGISITMAWLSINSHIESDGLNISLDGTSDLVTMDAYAIKYDGAYGAYCQLLGSNTDVSLSEFDKIFRDRNVNTPLVIRLDLGKVPDERDSQFIQVEIPCSKKYIIQNDEQINELNEAENNEHFIIQNYISNVCHVKIDCELQYNGTKPPVPTETIHSRDETTVKIFNDTIASFKEITSGTQCGQFATITQSEVGGKSIYVKNDRICLKIYRSVYHDGVFEETDDKGNILKHLVMYIQFDYDDTLIDAYGEHSVVASDGHVIFDCDIKTIVLKEGDDENAE